MRNWCVVRGALFNPAGFTILEVVVALALFGLILGVSGLAVAGLREPSSAATKRQLADARAAAIRTGRLAIVNVALPDTGSNNAQRTTHVLFLPDGRAIGPGLDPLTGASLGNP